MEENFYFLNSLNLGILILDHQKKVKFINEWLLSRIENEQDLKIGEEIIFDPDKNPRFIKAINDALELGLSSIISSRLNPKFLKLCHGKIQLSYNLFVSRSSKKSSKSPLILLQFLDVTQIEEREKYLEEKQKVIDQQREYSFNQERLASLGEMTTSMAHEINNPMAILEMNYDEFRHHLIEVKAMDPTFEELLKDGHQTIQRVNELINSIRALARNPNDEDFSVECLSSVIGTALIVFLDRAKSAGVEIRYDKELAVFKTHFPVNRSLMSQVFVNLLNNSFYAIKKLNEKWIEINGEVKDDKIILRFVDSGPGIAKELRHKIFIPFFTTKDVGDGTGLGLSTIKKIIEAHQGTISLDETCPHTCFLITLPLKRAIS